MKVLKNTILFLGGLFLIYLFFVSSIVFSPYINNYFNRIDFNSSEWKNWEETEKNASLRWNMVDDLEDNYNLVGKTKSEIIMLLGEPNSSTNNELNYYLGMSGHGIDTGSLTLTIQENKVVNSIVSRH